MRINTNVASLNAQRTLAGTGAAAAKSIGRLSSGFRINRAADDAAGLGIANKLRANIRSLRQASRNAEQATAMLQVAEGATQTIASILDRMKELAAQSASSNSGDRAGLQAEFDTLRTEITRIVNTTNYQGNKLIDGTMGNVIDAGTGTLDGQAYVQDSTIKINGAKVGLYTLAEVDGDTLSLTDAAGNVQVVDVAATGEQDVVFDRFGVSFRTSSAFDISTDTVDETIDVDAGASAADFLVSSSGAYTGNDLVKLATAIKLDTATLTISASSVASQTSAQTALSALDVAIGKVNEALSTLGATQNRVDFALENVKTTVENYASAESVVRDADMAAEMAEFTKQQILQQAGVAMLAQANSAPQLVLKLLG